MLTQILGSFINYYIVFTIALALVFRKSYFNSPQRIFFYVLLSLGIVDILGGALGKYSWVMINYNFGMIIHILGFIYYYYSIVNDKNIQRKYVWITVAFLLFVTFSFVFSTRPTVDFNSLNYAFGSLCLVSVIVLFFKKIINTEYILSLNKFLWFWVSIGLFLLYISMLPIMVSMSIDLNDLRDTLTLIQLGLNIVMYTFFNIGLIVSQKEYNALKL